MEVICEIYHIGLAPHVPKRWVNWWGKTSYAKYQNPLIHLCIHRCKCTQETPYVRRLVSEISYWLLTSHGMFLLVINIYYRHRFCD